MHIFQKGRYVKKLVLIALLIPSFAFAQYKVSGATIDKISLSNSFSPGTVFIKTSGGDITSPKASCATTGWSFTHKITDDAISTAQFSMLLTAKASGAKINFTGSGDCRVGYGVETLFTVELSE